MADKDCEKLPHSKTAQFHNLVAKTLYDTKRSRPYTCTAVVFLTTRVRAPNLDDWAEMVYTMRYPRGTRTLPLILSANGSSILKWWVDALFAVHPNIRGNSGGGLSLGCGFTIVSSTKQNLSIRSSTETELVGANDFMPEICWTRYFTIIMDKNEKASSSKRTKHIKIGIYLSPIGLHKATCNWYGVQPEILLGTSQPSHSKEICYKISGIRSWA